MKKRLIVLGSFAALSLSGAVFGDFQIFTDPGAFFNALEAKGKISKGFWDFKPNNVGPGFIAGISDPLNFITAPKTGIWDNMPLDNVQFQSNLNPQGEGGPNPRGANGLAFATAPFFGIKNNILVANTFVDSYDILSGVPEPDNHTAMAMNVVSLASGGGDVHVTVWDKDEQHMTKLVLPGPWQDNEKRFVGILAQDERSIGRVNIYDLSDGAEGISAIEVFLAGDEPDDCPWDLDNNGTVGGTDLLSLLVNWGPYAPCPPFKPMDFDQNCSVGATDLLKLLSNWGPCPGGKATGACCLSREDMGCGVVQPDPGCIITTAGECQAAGGFYLGDGVPCEQTTPTVIHNSKQLNHEVVTAARCGGAGPVCTDGPYQVDPWTTVDGIPGGTNAMDFGGTPIPADFFGPGSDPFDGQVQLRGQPLGLIQLPGFPDPLDFGEADTLVRRDLDPFDRCEVPPGFPSDPVEVNIEMVALSLRSCDPITVTTNGGQNPEEWDVRVNLSDFVPQPGGTLKAIKTHCNGGTYTSELAVCPVFIFTKVKNPQFEVHIDFCADFGQPLFFILNQDSPWVHDLSQSVGTQGGVCTDFYPGIDENDPDTDCDCNNNNVRDKCDIENGTSDDNNGDGIPDECQP